MATAGISRISRSRSSAASASLNPIHLLLGIAALMLILLPGCSSANKSQSNSEPEPQAAPAQTDDNTGKDVAPASDNTEKPMSGTQSDALTQINELLAKSPATTNDCGEKYTRVSRDGDKIVTDVTLADCERSYRFEVPLAKLTFDNIEISVSERRGRGQVFIICQNDESCATWLIRDNDGAEWRKVRDDSALVIDLAPNAEAADKLKELLTAWRGG